MSLDLEAIRARLMELAWVADVEVKRVFPETLQVAIHERHPAALWQHNGKLRLLDVDGHDFTPQDLRPFRDMMLLIGEDAPSHLLSLQKILATAPELQAHVKIAIRVGGRRWNLRFDNGMEVKLPEIEPEKAMAQLMNMHRKKSLWKSTIRSIDMRISGKIFIK